jgi:hypothetical protein
MTTAPLTLLLGFLAAAIAVVTVHQGIVFALNKAGVWPVKPWSTAPHGPYKVPTIVNSIFWGGLWGVVFAAFRPYIPGGAVWQQGLVFGLAIALFSNFTILPMIKGQPLFFGMDVKKMAIVLAILSGFGIATAVVFHWLRSSI